MLESFLEAILWKKFLQQHKTAVPSMLPSVYETDKIQLKAGKESTGEDAPILSRCSLLRNPWPKPTGVLKQCREGENQL